MAKRARRNGRGAGISVPAPAQESESVRIRKIANGYIISRSGTKRGKYFEHEEFSAGRPVVTAAQVPKPMRAAPRPHGHHAAQRRVLIG